MVSCVNEPGDDFDDCLCFAFFPKLTYVLKHKPSKWSVFARKYVKKQADKYFDCLKCTNEEHSASIRKIVVNNFDVLAIIYPERVKILEEYKMPKCSCHDMKLNECWFMGINTAAEDFTNLNRMVLRTFHYNPALYL